VAWLIKNDRYGGEVSGDVPISVDRLYIGNSGGSAITFTQTHDVTASEEILGASLLSFPAPHYVPRSHGVHVQNGGTNDIHQLLILADYNSAQEPSSGVYILNAGTLNAEFVSVAESGLGTFEQNGGNANLHRLWIGTRLDATGTYLLNGGSLITNSTDVGFDGNGTFIHTGGTHVVRDTLSLGTAGGSLGKNAGTYILSGADATLQANLELIGRHTPGTFIQSAGTHEVGFACDVGYLHEATYDMSGGSFNIAGELNVGRGGFGTFNHSGGAVIVGTSTTPGAIILGYSNIGNGTYNLSGDAASLTVWGTQYIGYEGWGRFDHSAGSHFVSRNLEIGGSLRAAGPSQYTLAGGSLAVGEMELMGVFGPGRFVQTGGSNSSGISVAIGSQGSYELRGGSLTTPALDIGDLGSFTWSGGSLSLNSLLVVGNFTVTEGAARTLHVDSLNVTISGKLDLTDNRMILDYTGTSPIGSLVAQIGTNIISTVATSDASRRIGYGEASDLGVSSFAGIDVDETTALLVLTYGGDANLNGVVDIDDLGQVAAHWQSSGDWFGGDFDYSGMVDTADLEILAANWQAGASAPGGPSLADALIALGLPPVSVPEPASSLWTLLGVTVALRCHCRRRRGRAFSGQAAQDDSSVQVSHLP
jgi:hypothetical protein